MGLCGSTPPVYEVTVRGRETGPKKEPEAEVKAIQTRTLQRKSTSLLTAAQYAARGDFLKAEGHQTKVQATAAGLAVCRTGIAELVARDLRAGTQTSPQWDAAARLGQRTGLKIIIQDVKNFRKGGRVRVPVYLENGDLAGSQVSLLRTTSGALGLVPVKNIRDARVVISSKDPVPWWPSNRRIWTKKSSAVFAVMLYVRLRLGISTMVPRRSGGLKSWWEEVVAMPGFSLVGISGVGLDERTPSAAEEEAGLRLLLGEAGSSLKLVEVLKTLSRSADRSKALEEAMKAWTAEYGEGENKVDVEALSLLMRIGARAATRPSSVATWEGPVKLMDELGAAAPREARVDLASARLLHLSWKVSEPFRKRDGASLVAHGGAPTVTSADALAVCSSDLRMDARVGEAALQLCRTLRTHKGAEAAIEVARELAMPSWPGRAYAETAQCYLALEKKEEADEAFAMAAKHGWTGGTLRNKVAWNETDTDVVVIMPSPSDAIRTSVGEALRGMGIRWAAGTAMEAALDGAEVVVVCGRSAVELESSIGFSSEQMDRNIEALRAFVRRGGGIVGVGEAGSDFIAHTLQLVECQPVLGLTSPTQANVTDIGRHLVGTHRSEPDDAFERRVIVNLPNAARDPFLRRQNLMGTLELLPGSRAVVPQGYAAILAHEPQDPEHAMIMAARQGRGTVVISVASVAQSFPELLWRLVKLARHGLTKDASSPHGKAQRRLVDALEKITHMVRKSKERARIRLFQNAVVMVRTITQLQRAWREYDRSLLARFRVHLRFRPDTTAEEMFRLLDREDKGKLTQDEFVWRAQDHARLQGGAEAFLRALGPGARLRPIPSPSMLRGMFRRVNREDAEFLTAEKFKDALDEAATRVRPVISIEQVAATHDMMAELLQRPDIAKRLKVARLGSKGGSKKKRRKLAKKGIDPKKQKPVFADPTMKAVIGEVERFEEVEEKRVEEYQHDQEILAVKKISKSLRQLVVYQRLTAIRSAALLVRAVLRIQRTWRRRDQSLLLRLQSSLRFPTDASASEIYRALDEAHSNTLSEDDFARKGYTLALERMNAAALESPGADLRPLPTIAMLRGVFRRINALEKTTLTEDEFVTAVTAAQRRSLAQKTVFGGFFRSSSPRRAHSSPSLSPRKEKDQQRSELERTRSDVMHLVNDENVRKILRAKPPSFLAPTPQKGRKSKRSEAEEKMREIEEEEDDIIGTFHDDGLVPEDEERLEQEAFEEERLEMERKAQAEEEVRRAEEQRREEQQRKEQEEQLERERQEQLRVAQDEASTKISRAFKHALVRHRLQAIQHAVIIVRTIIHLQRIWRHRDRSLLARFRSHLRFDSDTSPTDMFHTLAASSSSLTEEVFVTNALNCARMRQGAAAFGAASGGDSRPLPTEAMLRGMFRRINRQNAKALTLDAFVSTITEAATRAEAPPPSKDTTADTASVLHLATTHSTKFRVLRGRGKGGSKKKRRKAKM